MFTMFRRTLMPYVGWVCCWFTHAPRVFSAGTPVFPSPYNVKKKTKNKNTIYNFFNVGTNDNGNTNNNSNYNEGGNDNGNNSQ